MKKLLMLGGSDFQIPAIRRARAMGIHVVTCGNRAEDAGHAEADEMHLVSTTDIPAVLELAKRLNIDGISAYGSDPGALTAAFVSEELGLPGGAFAGVEVLQDKVRFRAVQRALGVPAPGGAEVESVDQVLALVAGWPHGGILKPVDTSGSKGVTTLPNGVGREQVEEALRVARSYSRSGKMVVEEFLVRRGAQMTGDALIDNGRIIFFGFGDSHWNDRITGLVPRCTTFLASVPMAVQERAIADAERIIQHLGITQGVFNMDVMEDDRGRSIIVDIAARNGGNMLSELIQRCTGVDLATVSIRQSMGLPVSVEPSPQERPYCAYIVLHSEHEGYFKEVRISPELEPHIFYRKVTAQPGDPVPVYTNASLRQGILLLQYPDRETMMRFARTAHEHVQVVLA